MSKKIMLILFGWAGIFLGAYLLLKYWNAFVLAIQASCGVFLMVGGAFAVYFASDSQAYKKLIYRLTHKE